MQIPTDTTYLPKQFKSTAFRRYIISLINGLRFEKSGSFLTLKNSIMY